MTLNYTGERVIPDQMDPLNGMLLEHIARYHFSLLYMDGRVLDFASGVGYGSQLIAKNLKGQVDEVVALDLSEETTRYARGRYYHPNVTYVVGDVLDRTLPEQLGTFDCIVSFETIEHVDDFERFMANVWELLKPGGTLVLSTPFGQGVGKPTNEPFHVHQFTEQEFTALFDRFASTEFYYQRGVLVEPKRPERHYPIGIAVATK
ncbi:MULTISPECIES: bifunctional 2-polyprenyl-6-hydroxyphenol methylase/3-demethylubiquinol 3-O-methyltransferase UbiG [Exiguobacterium]|uniref:class I SAM-dependent methyltransferase n=1 Tax=Exiguobacterium TaxID=33986 RepID=UPI0008778371|nr:MULTISPECIES: class I SAM-dependent methyltransferase [Exiguobacterium]TCI65790.1 class I SAM-dependent methyltransferase [Exiguobacterium sp. SH0S2]TCI79794.1 class I SAM-dependent methyltransferase [Exiguobacterium sp. SH0S1]